MYFDEYESNDLLYRNSLSKPLIDEIYDSEDLSDEDIDNLNKELKKLGYYLGFACGIALGFTAYLCRKKVFKGLV